jgi:hypothetical protein
MEDLDLQLEAFSTRLRQRLKRDLWIVASLPLAIGLAAGVCVGRATAPQAKAQIVTCAGAHTGAGFFLDANENGVRMKLEGYGD